MMPQPSILLAHGDTQARSALAHALSSAGLRVAEAASADACLRLAAEISPAVALVAQDLPGGDGLAVCRALRDRGVARTTRCALLATAPPDTQVAEALSSSADMWLAPPFSAPQLLALVRLLLRTHAAEREQALLLPYEKIVQSAMEGFWIVRASDIRFLAVNDAYCAMIGYSRDELLSMSVRDVEAIESTQDTIERSARIMRQGYDRFETRHRRKDGTIFDVEVSVRLIEAAEAMMVVFARDITASKRAEEDLRRSEARYRSLLEAIPDRVFRHDAQGRFIDYHNPRDAALIMPPEMFIGKHYRDVVPPAISEPFAAALERAASSGQMERFEYDLSGSDGMTHTFETRLVIGEDADIVTIIRDITEQRQAARAVQKQHKQFLTIFDAFPAILYVVDPTTDEVLFVNKVFQNLLGSNPIGGTCYREFQGLAERCPFCTNEIILRTRQPYTWEYHNPLLHTDFLITDQIICWPDGRDVRFELAIDITARKQAEVARERLSGDLARKNRELEQIVYVASHDLRSPLVNVQGFSRELQASLDDLKLALAELDLPATQRDQVSFLTEQDIPESLSYILTGVSKMDALLKGLLRLSRLGRAALSIEPLDVGQIVAETLIALDFQIKQGGIHVDLGPLPHCRGDATQVGQIFANLIGNALKYLAPERPGSISITGRTAEGMAVYCVADNGRGIAAEHQEKIFELYYRLEPAQSEGEGLGLTIVRTIAERLGGWVRVTSTPGVGSQFAVALPEAL
ncbi:PAS domain S-box protein [Oscillochloris sp. ZM17-4]|uniref:PAS domain S-box protein n=1 Tax=Oscillochloris sp. ZM17-4 TaxID=2866714 RepID=UPI001C73325A|nr:PAS domain S-box protein [Oscillochloris sp. ZM17-4]MBX0326777.1 PAS domain S-box protein [Oscillochloris sp. ZM17-4]